jgi:phage host-nuclease inhibitor protein Gam
MMLDADADQEAIQDTLEAIDGSIEEKADNYAYIIKELDSQMDMLKKEADRLKTLVGTISNNKDRLRSNLLNAMQTTGKLKFKTDRHSFSVRNSQSVDVFNEELIPDEYKKIEIKVSKTDISNALKNGGEVAGAQLIEKQSVAIR